MSFQAIYLLVRAFVRRLIGLATSEVLIPELLAENTLHRPRIAVPERTNPSPRLRRRDRLIFAALSRILPRERCCVGL